MACTPLSVSVSDVAAAVASFHNGSHICGGSFSNSFIHVPGVNAKQIFAEGHLTIWLPQYAQVDIHNENGTYVAIFNRGFHD